MISDCEFLEGSAFIRLINYGCRVTISHASFLHPSMYLIETESSKSAVLFKHSKKPKSSWSFSFSIQEEEALEILSSQYSVFSPYIALICHKDGICCVSKQRLMSILDPEIGLSGQYISVSRKPRGSYYLSGPGRQKMSQTVPQSDWPRVLLLEAQEKLYE